MRSSGSVPAKYLVSIWILALIALHVTRVLPNIYEYWISPDEGIYYHCVSKTHLSELLACAASQTHPPLYWLIVWLIGRFTTNADSMQLLSLFFSSMAMAIFIFCAWRLASISGALIVGTIISLSPGFIEQAGLIRPYALQQLLIGMICLDAVGFQGRWIRPLSIGAAAALVLTHLSGALLLGGLLIGSYTVRADLKQWRCERSFVFALSVMSSVILLALTLKNGLYYRVTQSMFQDAFPVDLSSFISLSKDALLYLFSLSTLPLVILLGLVGCGCNFGRLFIAPIVTVIALTFARQYPFTATRHLLFLLPVFLGLAVLGIRQIGNKVLVLVLAVLSIFALVSGPDRIDPRSRPEYPISKLNIFRLEEQLATYTSEVKELLMDQDTFYVLRPILGASLNFQIKIMTEFQINPETIAAYCSDNCLVVDAGWYIASIDSMKSAGFEVALDIPSVRLFLKRSTKVSSRQD